MYKMIKYNSLLGEYINGNTLVKIHSNGLKIRTTQDDTYLVDFPESFDCKITNYCNAGCSYCHEASNINGLHGDLSIDLFKNLKPWTEIAIGGGNPFDHPHLFKFLKLLRSQKVIANITINQKHLRENEFFIRYLISNNLLHGIGISITSYDEDFLSLAKSLSENIIFHIINGIVTERVLKALKNSKILILGYKKFRLGINYYENDFNDIERNMNFLKNNILEIIETSKVCSFDNLAIEQLDIKNVVSSDIWNMFYQGEDGSHTMYYDATTNTAAVTSTTPEDKRIPVMRTDNIIDIFNILRN